MSGDGLSFFLARVLAAHHAGADLDDPRRHCQPWPQYPQCFDKEHCVTHADHVRIGGSGRA